MSKTDVLSGIDKMLALYAASFNNRDPMAMASTLALDDPRFSEFEDVVPELMGPDEARRMLASLKTSRGSDMRFEDVAIHRLAADIAIVACMQTFKMRKSGVEEEFRSRVSLVAVRSSDGTWRIVHGHFSSVPSR